MAGYHYLKIWNEMDNPGIGLPDNDDVYNKPRSWPESRPNPTCRHSHLKEPPVQGILMGDLMSSFISPLTPLRKRPIDFHDTDPVPLRITKH